MKSTVSLGIGNEILINETPENKTNIESGLREVKRSEEELIKEKKSAKETKTKTKSKTKIRTKIRKIQIIIQHPINTFETTF